MSRLAMITKNGVWGMLFKKSELSFTTSLKAYSCRAQINDRLVIIIFGI
jgi:hypothetical protein